MPVRLGELLVRKGLMTPEQVEEVLEHQAVRPRPFGVLAEQLAGVTPRQVEEAWAEQYQSITGTIDVVAARVEPEALRVLSRRQAWQFRVLPLRFDQTELIAATTRRNLPRALRFALNVLETPSYFLLADTDDLDVALSHHYPMEGMLEDTVAA